MQECQIIISRMHTVVTGNIFHCIALHLLAKRIKNFQSVLTKAKKITKIARFYL